MAAAPIFGSTITSTRSSKATEFDDVISFGSRFERLQAGANGGFLKFAADLFRHAGNSARQRTAPPAAAAKRGSASTCSSIRFGSVATSVREGDVASFTAVRAVVKPIHAKTNNFACSCRWCSTCRQVHWYSGLSQLNAKHRAGGHRSLLEQTLPERVALRQVQWGDEFAACRHKENRIAEPHSWPLVAFFDGFGSAC